LLYSDGLVFSQLGVERWNAAKVVPALKAVNRPGLSRLQALAVQRRASASSFQLSKPKKKEGPIGPSF
jgi:hypothetical protein